MLRGYDRLVFATAVTVPVAVAVAPSDCIAIEQKLGIVN